MKRALYIFILFIFVSSSFLKAQTIQGLSLAGKGTTLTYSFTNGALLTAAHWTVTSSKGTVSSNWSSGTTYYANITWSATATGAATITFISSSLPSSPTKSVTLSTCPSLPTPTVSGSRCGTGAVTLTGTPYDDGYSLKWYDASSTYLTTALSYTTPSLSSTTTYYASNYLLANGCESAKAPAVATIVAAPTTSAAGTNSTLCGLAGTSLAANTPTVGTGAWTITSGPSTLLSQFSSTTSPTATFTPAGGAGNYVLTWTISNSTCTSSSNVTLTFTAAPTISNAGPNQNGSSTCGQTSVTLAANTPTVGTGSWSIAPDSPTTTGGSFGNTSSPGSTFTGTAGSSYDLVWTITSGSCTSVSEVPVTFNKIPNVAATANPTVCSGSIATITLSNPNNVSGTTYSWTSQPTNATIPVATSGNSITGTFYNSDGVNTGSSVYTITPATSTCIGTPITATVNINSTPLMPALASFVGYIDNPAVMQVNVPTGQQPRWYADNVTTTTVNTTPTYQIFANQSHTYYVSLKDLTNLCESGRAILNAIFITKLPSPASVTEEMVRLSGKTTDSDIDALTTSQKAKVISFYDGLARTTQVVAINATSSGKDIVQPVEYDSYGNSSKNYLPYSIASTGVFQFSYASDQYAFYQASNDKIADDISAFAVSKYELSPLGRPLEQGSVGQAFQPGLGHTKRATYGYNIGSTNDEAEEVRKFNTDGSSSGYYGANVLSRTAVTDENGNINIIFKDGSGHTIARKQQLNGTINSVAVNYLQTYYVYDNLFRLKYIIPPAGLAALKSNSWTLSSTILDQHVYQFVYDNRGRITQKKTPGQDWVYFVYDRFNRLVLTQDGNLRPLKKWAFVKYDLQGRTVMTGLYKNLTQTTLASIQTMVSGLYATGVYFEKKGTTLYSYTNQSFPTINSDNSAIEVLGVNYYDDYSFTFNNGSSPAYDNAHLAGLPATQGKYTRGKMTGNRTLILGTANWMVSALFYDNYGRVIQTQGNNHLYLNGIEKSSVIYDFEGKATQTKATHSPDGTNITILVQTPVYDNQGRVYQLNHSINGAAAQLVAQYEYNELGQVVDKKLHNTAGSFLQSVDYRFNIRGQLISINNGQLSADASNDETNDFFGMELLYNNIEAALGNTPQYNGNVSALKWKGLGNGSTSTGQRSYKLAYDKTNKLTSAAFQKYGAAAWDQEVNTWNESMTYDHNGNMASLQRNQNFRGLSGTTVTSTPLTIDNLTYAYTEGNRLSKVTDAATTAGFNDGSNQTTEYTYDTHGNLATDLNKGISSITYNVLGKAQQVNFADGRTVAYTYAGGNKIKMVSTVSGVPTTTDYSGGFVYTNNALSFFSSPEGRVVKNGSTYEYQYGIADHQGNTRVVFSSVTPAADAPTATFEGDANDGAAQYINGGLNIVSFGNANHTTSGSKVVRMNQSNKIGPAKSVKVYPGDKIDIEVWEYHEAGSGYGTTGTALNNLITSVAGAFTGVVSPTEVGMMNTGVSNALTFFGTGGNQGDLRPAAYLNYILFDKNYNVLDAGWQLAPATTFTKQKISFPTKTITEPGYVYTWLSYDDASNNYVYFDDFKVTQTKTNVIQYNEYYPFGLQTTNSWTRDNALSNNFLYNESSELNNTTGLYDLPFRNYDASLGRFFQVDPLAHIDHSTSPFAYAGNNPILFNDPSGLLKDIEIDVDYWNIQRANAAASAAVNAHLWSSDIGSMGGGGGYNPYWDAVHMSMDAYLAKYSVSAPTNSFGSIINALSNGGSVSASGNSIYTGYNVSYGASVQTDSQGNVILDSNGNETAAGFNIFYHDQFELKTAQTSGSGPYSGIEVSLDGLRQYLAIVAGESGNNIDEASAIGSVILNRLAHKGADMKGDFVSKIGGKGQYDAIGGKIYNEVMALSTSDLQYIIKNPLSLQGKYSDRVIGALGPLMNGVDYSQGAYFWNASSPQTGFNWNQYNNGTFVQTTSLGGTTFFKYADGKGKTWP